MLRRRRASVVTHAQRGDHVFLNFRNASCIALTTQARVNCATRATCPVHAGLDSGDVWCVLVIHRMDKNRFKLTFTYKHVDGGLTSLTGTRQLSCNHQSNNKSESMTHAANKFKGDWCVLCAAQIEFRRHLCFL